MEIGVGPGFVPAAVEPADRASDRPRSIESDPHAVSFHLLRSIEHSSTGGRRRSPGCSQGLQLQPSCFPCRPQPQTSIKSATSDSPVSIRPPPPPSEQSNFVMFGTRRRRPHRRLVLQITISGHASNYESKGPSFLLSLRGSKSSSLAVEERGENGAASQQQQQDKGRRRHCTDTTTMHMHRQATTEVTWH